MSFLIALAAMSAVSTVSLAETEAEADTVIIATRHAPPFAIKTAGGWDGITIELVRRIASERGVVFAFEEMGLEEMLEATSNGEVRAAAAALTITAERERRVDFSHPFFTSGLGIAVRRGVELTLLSTLRRFASGAFFQAAGALLAVLALVGILVWVVERRRNNQFAGDPIKGIGSGIWWSAVTMTTVGYGDKAPLTMGGRIIGVVWMFASIIMISGFTAAIATSLTVGQLEQSIVGIDDLYRRRVLTAEGSTSAAYLDEKLVRYQTAPTVADALEKLAAGQADAVVHDLPILRYLIRNRDQRDLNVLPISFARQDYGIALPPGAPLREELNQAILEIIDGADWARLLEGYLGAE